MYLSNHIHQLVNECTRFRHGNEPSILDLILVSDTALTSDPEFLSPIGNSDHVTLSLSIQLTSCKETIHNNFKTITTTDFTKLSNDLSSAVFSLSPDIDKSWSSFSETLSSLVSKHSYTRQLYHNPSKPWISINLRNKILHKRNLWKRYKRTRSPTDFQAHRTFSNQLIIDIKNCRKIYESNIVNSNNPKQLFKYIRSNSSSKVSIPRLRKPCGLICENDQEVADLFADCFTFSYTIEPVGPLNDILGLPRNEESLTDIVFEPDTVLKYLLKMSSTSSPGPDNISPALLKSCASQLNQPLALLMSTSFASSKLPISWKSASITPIFKKGDKLQPCNYRPISLTSVVVKVMEAIVVAEMRPFLISTGVIPDEQHGFVPGRSVTTNLLKCLNDWTKAVDAGENVDVIYLDFCKAFDKVPHNRLLHKLEHCGIRGLLLNWIRAFLANRTFAVRINKCHSRSEPVISGVAQGSVLGPLLFLVYVADLRHVITSPCSFYADDVKFYAQPSIQHNILQDDLCAISVWCDIWLLDLNISKCIVLHIGKKNPAINYTIKNHTLEHASQHSDLGVIIASDLSWSLQTASAAKRGNLALHLIRSSFVDLDPRLLLKLFNTYVRPHLEYAATVWSPVLMRDKNLLEQVQRRATKIPFQLQSLRYEDRLTSLKIISLTDRRMRGDLIFTYRALHNKFSVNMSSIYELNSDNRLRGHSFKLKRTATSSVCRSNFLTNRVFHQWNYLPESAVTALSVNTFKNAVDQILFCIVVDS